MDFDPRNPLPHRHQSSSQALIQKYFHLEIEFMAASGYHKQKKFSDIRSIALSDIEKYSSDEVDLIVIFLAITYFDRFLSRNINIPVIKSGEGFESNLKLFVFCCVSIASKMCCSNFSLLDFLDEHQVGSATDVLVMELQILEGLRWRIRPLTAITFAYFLLPLVKTEDEPEWLLITPVSQAIVAIQRDIRFTEFRPSSIAASAILVTSYKMHSWLDSKTLRKVLRCGFIQQSEVEGCFDELKEHAMVDYILRPDKNPLDKFKQRFRQPEWWKKGKEVRIHEPVSRVRRSRIREIVEVKVAAEEQQQQQQQQEEEIAMEPDPNMVEGAEARRYNPFQRFLITCFLPIVCTCFGYEFRRREDPIEHT